MDPLQGPDKLGTCTSLCCLCGWVEIGRNLRRALVGWTRRGSRTPPGKEALIHCLTPRDSMSRPQSLPPLIRFTVSHQGSCVLASSVWVEGGCVLHRPWRCKAVVYSTVWEEGGRVLASPVRVEGDAEYMLWALCCGHW